MGIADRVALSLFMLCIWGWNFCQDKRMDKLERRLLSRAAEGGVAMAILQEFSGAELSPCRRYRYELWRKWDEGEVCCFIGLNPSTADETTDDATIRKCRKYAKRWGFAGMLMLNVFAFRATNPADMKAAQKN